LTVPLIRAKVINIAATNPKRRKTMAKKEKKITKIVLYMAGGCIQDVHTDGLVDITIVDKDELVNYGLSSDERDAAYKKACKGLKANQNWGFLPNPMKTSSNSLKLC